MPDDAARPPAPVSEFTTERVVEFFETDMAGILHFSNYFRYMEAAEHAFFRSLGLRVHVHGESGVWGWARGRAECRYTAPLRYEDVVRMRIVVREQTEKTMTYDVDFLRRETDGGFTPVARGAMTVICVANESGRMRAIPIPDEIRARIGPAGGESMDRAGRKDRS